MARRAGQRTVSRAKLHQRPVRLAGPAAPAPHTLDPARRSAQVTREVAKLLAQLAHTLEQRHPPEHVAAFLTRCLFSMFAEDVGLLPTVMQPLRAEWANAQAAAESLPYPYPFQLKNKSKKSELSPPFI